jgi:hypothetical protein
MITNHAEGTIESLRYNLGGDRPSQTTRLTRSLRRIHAGRLEFKQSKGGISLVAPRHLAAPLHSLPPMLHMLCPNPMLRYSKASRGLSVHMRVTGVFTGTTSSPSPWSRQRPNRYAFRAGRNLPDKEFRYLRTVIVTAAVYRGFGSKLRLAADLSP